MTDTVDTVVAQIDPSLPPPSIARRDVVLVAGPWLAGTTNVVAALRDRLPEYTVVEADGLAAGEAPTAVVFVVSATAPLTESDCALLDSVAADTDAVIGVVSKIDVHRTWRDVLVANDALLAQRAARYRDMPWVGAAAAPDLGPPVVDDLVATLRATLADDTLQHRNRLRAWENRLLTLTDRLDRDAAGGGRQARLSALREQRAETLRQSRLARSERTIAMRSQLQQARLQLSYFARNRCASVRSELQEDVADLSRRTLGGFGDYVHRRAAEVADEVHDGVTRQLADVAAELDLSVEPDEPTRPVFPVGPAPPRSRGPETRLMLLLGAGFGLGLALTLSRLIAGLAPQWTLGGAVGGVIVGVGLTLWLVGVRALLHDRAVLDRWVVEVITGLRTRMEEWVAVRALAAEAALSRAAAEREVAETVRTDDVVAGIDREIREHTAAGARAAANRDRRGPVITRALAAVRAERDALNR